MCTRLGNSRYMQYLSAITATLSVATTATYGFWPSPSLPKLQSDDSPVGRPITDEEGSWVVALLKLSAASGSFLAAFLVEKIGRKRSLLLSVVLLLFPWFMIIFGKSLILLYAARLIAGTGAGVAVIASNAPLQLLLSTASTPVAWYIFTTFLASGVDVSTIYNGEIAENDIRGKLGTCLTILRLAGSLMILCVGPYVSYTNLAILSASIPVLFLCIFPFMPESPYYLVKINKQSRAEAALRLLSSKANDDTIVKDRLLEIENSVKRDMQNKSTVWEFFSNPLYRKAIFIMIGIKSLQQLSGDGAISSYMQPIIRLTKSNISPEASSIIFGLVQLPAALAAGFLVDKIGRKPLLIISASGCAIALFAEGAFFYCQDVLKADMSSVAWLPTLGIAMYLIMEPLGIISLPFVLVAELFPTNIKGIAVSASTFYGAALNFLVSKFFKPLANAWGIYSVFWLFCSMCVIGTVFVWVAVPETKGKSFAEIQAMLRKEDKDEVELEKLKNNTA